MLACPTHARHYGDFEDPGSNVSKLSAERGGFGLLFWVVFLFGVFCVLAGAAIAIYAPMFLPGGEKAAPVPPDTVRPAAAPAWPGEFAQQELAQQQREVTRA